MGWKSLVLKTYVFLVLLGVAANVVLLVERRFGSRPLSLSRALPSAPPDCGIHGVCQFRNSSQNSYACLCEVGWATFPERDCGFDTASSLETVDGVVVTVSKCTLPSSSAVPKVFYNPHGPCSYPRVSMASVAAASWIGGVFGADWYLMNDVHGCPACYVDGSEEQSYLWRNEGYIAAGFFAMLTADYLTIGWWVNSIRILVSRFSSIPFWDTLGFLHSDTINELLING